MSPDNVRLFLSVRNWIALNLKSKTLDPKHLGMSFCLTNLMAAYLSYHCIGETTGVLGGLLLFDP